MKGNRRKSGTVAACAAIAVLVGAVLGGGPALAEEHHTDWLRLLQQHGVDPHAEHAEPLVEEVQTRGNRFEAMAGEADETSESDSAEIIEEVVYTSDVAIPSSSDGEITLTSDAGDLALTLPEPGSSDREVLTERVSVFAHGDGSSSVPIVRDNGFQVVTVISGSDAPTSYTYELDLNGGRMELTDAGSVAVYDAADGFVGAFDAPWATDDEGRQVATSFSIQGSYLVQSVEHGVPGVA